MEIWSRNTPESGHALTCCLRARNLLSCASEGLVTCCLSQVFRATCHKYQWGEKYISESDAAERMLCLEQAPFPPPFSYGRGTPVRFLMGEVSLCGFLWARYPCAFSYGRGSSVEKYMSESDAAERMLCLQATPYTLDNLLVRIHCIIEMIRWTGLAPWGFEFPFPGSLIFYLPSTSEARSTSPSRTRPSACSASSRHSKPCSLLTTYWSESTLSSR